MIIRAMYKTALMHKRFNGTSTRQGIVPAEAGEGCKVAKTVGMDLGVVKAVKQRRSTF